MEQGTAADDIVLTSLVLLSLLANNEVNGQARMKNFRVGQAWLLSMQNGDGSFGDQSRAKGLRHSAISTLFLAESSRLGIGQDVTGSCASATGNLLARESPRGGWPSSFPDEGVPTDSLSVDPVTTTWVALALSSNMANDSLDKDTRLECAGAIERAARFFRGFADPTSGLIQIDGHVSMAWTLCGLVVRELSGEDLSELESTDATFALLSELRPDWREDPTYFVFAPWLMLHQGKQAFEHWDRNGGKDPLRFGVQAKQKSAWIQAEGEHEAGSLGAQALGNLSLSFYFRRFIVLMPSD